MRQRGETGGEGERREKERKGEMGVGGEKERCPFGKADG